MKAAGATGDSPASLSLIAITGPADRIARQYGDDEKGAGAMRVMKWGDSLAIQLPRDLVKALELHEGDEVDVVVERRGKSAMNSESGVDDRLNQLRCFRGKLPADFRFSRDGTRL